MRFSSASLSGTDIALPNPKAQSARFGATTQLMHLALSDPIYGLFDSWPLEGDSCQQAVKLFFPLTSSRLSRKIMTNQSYGIQPGQNLFYLSEKIVVVTLYWRRCNDATDNYSSFFEGKTAPGA